MGNAAGKGGWPWSAPEALSVALPLQLAFVAIYVPLALAAAHAARLAQHPPGACPAA
jgi:hypothetical protein